MGAIVMHIELLYKKFCNSKGIQGPFRYGLTLVEVLIILFCIVFILVVLLPTIRDRHEPSYGTVCANNVRQILLGLLLYADENDSNLPLQPDAYSLNEISKESSVALMLYSGINIIEVKANNQGDIPPQHIFYCPANLPQKRNNEVFWNASKEYRTFGYFFIIDSKEGREKIKGSGDKIWLKRLNIKEPSNKELITDIVICDDVNYKPPQFPKGNFAKCSSKILGEKGFEASSHLIDANKPHGGNIGFVDGHVEWRYFQNMEKRYGQNPVCWW